MYPYTRSSSWYLSPNDVEGTLSRVPLSCPFDKVLVWPFVQVCLNRHPSWPLAHLELYLFTWARAGQHKESKSSSDSVARSSCLARPAEAKRRNLFLGRWLGCPMDPEGRKCCWPGPRNWEIRGWLCILSPWGYSCLLSLDSTDWVCAGACPQG